MELKGYWGGRKQQVLFLFAAILSVVPVPRQEWNGCRMHLQEPCFTKKADKRKALQPHNFVLHKKGDHIMRYAFFRACHCVAIHLFICLSSKSLFSSYNKLARELGTAMHQQLCIAHAQKKRSSLIWPHNRNERDHTDRNWSPDSALSSQKVMDSEAHCIRAEEDAGDRCSGPKRCPTNTNYLPATIAGPVCHIYVKG